MTPRELEEIYIKVWKETYKLPKLLRRLKTAPSLPLKMIVLGANLGFKFVGMSAERG